MLLRETGKDEASKLSALYGYYVHASGVFQDFKRAHDTALLPESGDRWFTNEIAKPLLEMIASDLGLDPESEKAKNIEE
jgi:hypothetical protein